VSGHSRNSDRHLRRPPGPVVSLASYASASIQNDRGLDTTVVFGLAVADSLVAAALVPDLGGV
jgi:hypothetical protein